MGTAIGPRFAKFLEEEGLLPEGCKNMQVMFSTDAAVMVRYEVFMTDDRLDRFRRAFQRYLDAKVGIGGA